MKILITNPQFATPKKPMEGYLQVGDGTLNKESIEKITKRICKENPDMTVKDFLNKFHKKRLVLV